TDAAPQGASPRSPASHYPRGTLAWEGAETAAAACRAARACRHQAVTTQGHVLTVTSFAATLAVEAAVHYLDMTVELPGAPAPDPASLTLVRRAPPRPPPPPPPPPSAAPP